MLRTLLLTLVGLQTILVSPAVALGNVSFQQTVANNLVAPIKAPPGMVFIPGGEFSMGSEHNSTGSEDASRGSENPATNNLCGIHEKMRDARPVHRVYVDGFWMDKTEVTNDQFRKFVQATGYKTVAEIAPTQAEFPTAPKENLVAGSTVFTPTPNPVPLTNMFRWWRYQHGADWQHPEGPKSNIVGRDNYPVVQIAYPDAEAYAKWAHKRLPTEAEWEFAARGGQTGTTYTWGNDFKPGGKWMANIYEGTFPVKDSAEDGYAGLAPVCKFPPNRYGLCDMAGNVWEWCSDWYRADYYEQLEKLGSLTRNPKGPSTSWDPAEPNEKKRVQRGGSFLCTDQYCTRYMVGTRGKGDEKTASNHLGFRCVKELAK